MSGTKSVYLPSNAILKTPESLDFEFGTGDFTIEAWIRPAANVGTQYLFDFRRLSSTQGLNIRMDGQAIMVYNGTTLGINSGNVVATTGTWYHLSVVRASGVTQLYVNGAQVGSNWADTNTYLYAAASVGMDFNQTSHWAGHIDNL